MYRKKTNKHFAYVVRNRLTRWEIPKSSLFIYVFFILSVFVFKSNDVRISSSPQNNENDDTFLTVAEGKRCGSATGNEEGVGRRVTGHRVGGCRDFR